jgi:hypothetical protein
MFSYVTFSTPPNLGYFYTKQNGITSQDTAIFMFTALENFKPQSKSELPKFDLPSTEDVIPCDAD